jgi:hypothetical protein
MVGRMSLSLYCGTVGKPRSHLALRAVLVSKVITLTWCWRVRLLFVLIVRHDIARVKRYCSTANAIVIMAGRVCVIKQAVCRRFNHKLTRVE